MIASHFANLVRLLLFPLFAFRRARAAPRGALVTLEIDGALTDLTPPLSRFRWFRREKPRVTSVTRLRELARALKGDRRVAGIFLKILGVSAGDAVLASFRDVLLEIRTSGKDVVAYLPLGADNQMLYLASAARLVIAGPETMVAPIGYATSARYMKRALDHAGVEPEVFARGTYKSAGETLVLDAMSEPQREQLGAIVDARYETLVAALMEGRSVDRAAACVFVDTAPHTATAAKELGLIDAIAYEDELAAAVGAPWKLVGAEPYLAARLAGKFGPVLRKSAIGVIEVHGPIVSRARFELVPLASEKRIVASVRAARRDPRIRGVVLHIDSPGGSALASDRIHHEVELLAAEKPVVAYFSNVAASGGYYVAAGAHSIVARPESITGSIGVVSARFVFGPLLDKLGISIDVVKRGAHADMFSSAHKLGSEERALVEHEMDAIYEGFLRVVAKGRGRDVEAIRPLAGGRVYNAADAHEVGLVDILGGFDRAVTEVRTRIGSGAEHLEPRRIRARGDLPAVPRGGDSAQQAARVILDSPLGPVLQSLGLGGMAVGAVLALNLDRERVCAYFPGV